MLPSKGIKVPHLGGIIAAYQTPFSITSSKPTVIMINSFTTSAEQYRAQFSDKGLTSVMNLVAIEPLGHGNTRTGAENWTFWDSAIMNLQLMDELKIRRAFVLGTSQGGWIAVRMALLAPERIQGIIPLGTSLDSESERSRSLGCWNAPEILDPLITSLTTHDFTPGFMPSDEYCDLQITTSFGKDVPSTLKDFWRKEIKENYRGHEGRRRFRIAAINLRDRDGLLDRLGEVKCPVLRMHGTDDVVYSVANAEEEMQYLKNSSDARLVIVKDGQHFLSAKHSKEVKEHLLEFVRKHGK